MSLIGTIDTLTLADLFEVLASRQKSGVLHVRSEQGLGIVYFTDGKVCAGEAGHRAGPVEGQAALAARLFDVCFELFRFEEGSFEFEANGRPTWPANDSMKVSELLAETTRRLAEWDAIRVVVPSLEARPRLVPEAPEGGVTLDAAQWRVVAAIDGRRRVSALIRVLDGSDFEVCQRLASLVETGIVALDAPEPASTRSETADLEGPAPEAPAERRRSPGPAERRRSAGRASRLASVIDDDPDFEEGGTDGVSRWDDQIMAGFGGFHAVRRSDSDDFEAGEDAGTEPSAEAGPPADATDGGDGEGEGHDLDPERIEEPEVLTTS